MDVTDFKGPAPGGESRAVASSNSGHRQTVPTSAEEAAEQEELAPAPIHGQPPPYDPASARAPAANNTSTSTATPAQNDDAPAEATRSSRHSSRSRTSGINQEGYQYAENMTWEQKDASGYWDRYNDEEGAFCSTRGGCCFSDRDGCCFSDRQACCFSDRDACCFSDRDGCCFSDNDGCCFSDNNACCCSGTRPNSRRKLIPSMGTLFRS